MTDITKKCLRGGNVDLVKEIKSTIAKIKNLEKNKKASNAEIIEVELEGERNKLNEYFKMAKQEELRGQIHFVGYQKAGGQAYGL